MSARKLYKAQDIRLTVPHAFQCNTCRVGDLHQKASEWFPNVSGGLTIGSIVKFLHECNFCHVYHWMDKQRPKVELRMSYKVEYYQSATDARMLVVD